jgi:hypothetical protein
MPGQAVHEFSPCSSASYPVSKQAASIVLFPRGKLAGFAILAVSVERFDERTVIRSGDRTAGANQGLHHQDAAIHDALPNAAVAGLLGPSAISASISIPKRASCSWRKSSFSVWTYAQFLSRHVVILFCGYRKRR